jgi:hypothetical protein
MGARPAARADDQHLVPGFAWCPCPGTVDPERSVAAQRAYLGAYFDQFLKGRPQRLLLGESPQHPDVEFTG